MGCLTHVDLSSLSIFLWVCVRLDLTSNKVERALAVPDTVRVEVAVKVILATLTAEAKEEEEGEEGEACDTTHYATDDSAGV